MSSWVPRGEEPKVNVREECKEMLASLFSVSNTLHNNISLAQNAMDTNRSFVTSGSIITGTMNTVVIIAGDAISHFPPKTV